MKLYNELAEWWPLMSPAAEYAEEAAFYAAALAGAADAPLRWVLELGSGGGHNASHMKARFAMTLAEPSAGMRAVSQALNPDCEHVAGDMRTLRLGRTFDAVFVHDAVCYMTTEADLRRAMETAFVHCRSGGGVLFAPDAVREHFSPSTDHGGADGDDGRAMRWLEWTWDPDPGDTTCIVDYVYALRGRDGRVTVEHDRHVEGVFATGVWLRLLAGVGFVDARVLPFEHSEVEPGSHVVFVARKP